MLKVPVHEIAERIVALQSLLRKDEVDAAVIRQNADMYYFSGTVQDAHLIIPAEGQPVFLVRKDFCRAQEQSPLRPVVPLKSMKDLAPAVFQVCGDRGPKRLGFELDVLPANSFFFYDEKIFPKQQLVDISGLIRQVRMVKSPWELEMMRRAGNISRLVYEAVPQFLREGMTELELSAELEAVARKAGHLGLIRLRGFNMDMYFGHILSGADAAISSYADAPTGGTGLSPAFGQGPGQRHMAAGEVVSVDTMINWNGYLNDQTRNFCMGTPPAELQKAYAFVREVHYRLVDLAVPGAVTGQLYDMICHWADEAGWSENFMGNGGGRVSFIGHGLGLEVDEFPFIAKGQGMKLDKGMTFALEPKIILPGMGIVGLENTYVVGENGLVSFNSAGDEMVIL